MCASGIITERKPMDDVKGYIQAGCGYMTGNSQAPSKKGIRLASLMARALSKAKRARNLSKQREIAYSEAVATYQAEHRAYEASTDRKLNLVILALSPFENHQYPYLGDHNGKIVAIKRPITNTTYASSATHLQEVASPSADLGDSTVTSCS